MGSSASKTARVVKPAASAARRAAPQTSIPGSTSPGSSVGRDPRAAGSKDETILRDASDPDFANMLKSMGPVASRPSSTDSSAWSKLNPAQKVLYRRQEIAAKTEEEFEEKLPRTALDVGVIGEIIDRRAAGESAESIEEDLGLKKGIVKDLGGSVKRL